MADDLMRYDQLFKDALRGVVRVALERAASPEGLPAPHHFYITFKTGAPGVILPEDLKDKYPDEMTIVLKTRFWDLEVAQEQFSVRLTFNGVPAQLTIPYLAVTRFLDPTVPFRLEFEVAAPEVAAAEPDPPPEDESAGGGGEVLSLDAFRKK